MTNQEIELTTVVRATFENNIWNIVVTDENQHLYGLRIEGNENDNDDDLLDKIEKKLLTINKYVPPVLYAPTTKESLVGKKPKKKEN
jgi:hypothetical protein